jgi:ATP-dependent DNA helicase RecQ
VSGKLQKKTSTPDILQIARDRLGFSALRPGQQEAIEAILSGRDSLVVQPTGSGKSAIYQIAGLLIDGSTVVVSPLIALQKDQVDSIRQQNSAEALALNSSKPVTEFRESVQEVEDGQIEYIFLAPEQLHKPEILDTLRRAQISLFVVDEAHCISQWGHDFRPDYLALGHVIESLGHPCVLALTATASRKVRDEIATRLHMRDPQIFVRGFDRPNIYLRVDPFESEQEKRDALVHRVLWAEKTGIVYTGTRKAATEITQDLLRGGVEALFYHGGLKAKDRESIHERFMNGKATVIVATNAFGMGVDKPDIRFVFHHDPPESLDAYYQEIGRAGRDGEKSEAVLFYRKQNIGAQSFKTGGGVFGRELLEKIVDRLAQADAPVGTEELGRAIGLSRRRIEAAIQRLEDAEAIDRRPGGNIALLEGVDSHRAARVAFDEQQNRRRAKKEFLRQMQDYAESSTCRRQLLLEHLGDPFRGPCGFCDNCEASRRDTADDSSGVRREVFE